MRRTKTGLAAAATASAVVIALVVGCGAEGSSGSPDDTAAVDPTDPKVSLPPPSEPGEAQVDAAAPPKDGGVKSVDAGPPPPDAGSPCATIDEIKTKKCGACGTQSTVCLADGDGGAGKWSVYGACTGELAGGCVPGTVVTEACGNCGTVTKTCSSYCAFTSGTCTGQPASSCVPGAVDLSTAGCATADTYRQRTCAASCTYGSFGATCSPAPATIQVPPSPGQITTALVTLTSTKTIGRLGGTCPAATIAATATPYAYVTVHNPNAKAATVAVYNQQAPGGTIFPTLLASYAGATVPATAAARKACVKGVNDFGDDTLTGDSSFASLSDVDAVTIPAGGSVVVYDGAQDKYDAANPTGSTGKVLLAVQLISLP
jgi:hypothetical protein